MNYQDYEDYMRSVLGYQNNNIYANTYGGNTDYYYNYSPNMNYTDVNNEALNNLYPEIYKLLNPMVCKICTQNSNKEITKELVDNMTEEIYLNFESEDSQRLRSMPPLKNGDVRNPNAKEPELRSSGPRQGNYLLKDLIRILILKEFGRPGFYLGRPPIVPPPPPQRPPVRPGNNPNWRPY